MSIFKNHVDLIGYVGQRPELRRTKRTKTKVTSFSIGINESWTDRETGERQEADTLWVKVRCWGRLAEVMAEYLDKGSLVNVVGKLVQPEAWENRDGDIDCQAVVQARNILFLDRAPRDEDEDERPARRQSRRSDRRISATRRTSSSRRTESRSATRRKDSILEDLSDEEIEELQAMLKERDEKPAKRSSTSRNNSSGSSSKRSAKVVEEVADEDQPEDIGDVEEIADEEKPRKQPRQSAKKAPFARK